MPRRWRRPRRPATSISTPGPAAASGARARPAGTSCGSSTGRSTATATRCCVTVDPVGPTCHRDTRSCFDPDGAPAERASQGFAWLETLWATIAARAAERPAGSYTTSLLDGGVDAAARKVTEEATEVLLAAKDDAAAEAAGTDRTADQTALAGEPADLLYHALVLLAERDTSPAPSSRPCGSATAPEPGARRLAPAAD